MKSSQSRETENSLIPQKSMAADVGRAVMGEDVVAATQIGKDRGVFSSVWRVALASSSVIVKLPGEGPNYEAALLSGAFARERLAYEALLSESSPTPHCFGILGLERGPAFVLEDLADSAMVDQIHGLDGSQVNAIVRALAEIHCGVDPEKALAAGVREVTPRGFRPEALARGLEYLPPAGRLPLERLLAERLQRIENFGTLTDPVFCHGDPRADNVAFCNQRTDSTGVSAGNSQDVVLFDWQQIALQAGEADLAWLMATSVDPSDRPEIETAAVALYADRMGRRFDESWARYKASLVVPGLAVLLLAQRKTEGRLAELVNVSIERISSAVADHLAEN